MLRAAVPLQEMQDANQLNYKEEKEYKVVPSKSPSGLH